MIAINNLSFYFGDRPLYKNISWHIKPKDRVALIGANGTGKTTLLRLITEQYTPTEGEISKAKDCSIGYLNQDLLSQETDKSILDVTLEAFSEIIRLEKEINEILLKLETDYSDDLIQELANKQERFEAGEGYTLKSKAEEVLEGLGFRTEQLQQPLSSFSGGWRMRVMLAKLLLQKPSLLLLDEPTNHLDLPTIEWIEKYLVNYEGAYIVVSHDKEFLNNTVTSVAELSRSNIQIFKGNYDKYLIEREEQREIQHNAHINQQKKIKDTEKFINKFRAKATKSNQVQSRIKALERMEVIEDVESDAPVMSLRFKVNKQPGRFLYEMENIKKSNVELIILDDSYARIEKDDKIAFIGANGKGKSTMLRIIDGSEPHDGEVKEGYNVEKSFFAQHQLESLGQENTILGELLQAGTSKTEQELRSVLGCFLFGSEAVEKKIKVLSGGEKSRVALAKTLIMESNFLLLDEPTNHLDIQSVNTLVDALNNYEGSFVVVSHNRDFISRVANKVWYIEDHLLKEYLGTYEEFTWWRKKQEESKQAAVENNSSSKKETKKPRNDKEFKEAEKLQKKIKAEIAKVEEEIEKLDAQKKELEEQMSDPKVYANLDVLAEKTADFESLKIKEQELNDRWEELVTSLG